MFFASPIWLALLLPPWAAVAVWLMWSRRGARTDVPFLALWRDGAENSPREKREFRPPPWAVVAALAAAGLAIVAAARPGIFSGGDGDRSLVTIIVDCGVTMSAGDRLKEAIEAAQADVTEALGEGPTDLVVLPDGNVQSVSRAEWSQVALKAAPTQERTTDHLKTAVQRALTKTDGPVVVLSDQAIAEWPRVVQIAPEKPIENVAITRFAIRESPTPQAMVTVANFSRLERATLRVRSGERAVVERTIDLPRTRGGEAKFFLDLRSLDAAAVAEIDVADDIAIDNVAHAKRQRNFPAIELRAPGAAAEVKRVVDAYAKARPAGDGSGTIAIVADDSVPGDVPVAIVTSASVSSSSSGGGGGVGGDAGAVTVAAHPVSAGVDWDDAKAQATGTPPGQGWREVVSVGGRAAVAVRESPHRQVWIGLDAPEFARTADFVIFWTNVFDWLAGAGNEADGAVGDATQHWASTVVPPIAIAPAPTTDWRSKLGSFKTVHRTIRDVTSAVLLASVICLMLAALAWPGRSLTPFSAARTV